jgi:hypothetical protein
MKHLLSASYRLTLAFITVLFFSSTSEAQVSSNPLMQELLKLEQALNAGVKNHDTVALKEIISREYQLTSPRSAQPVPRDKWLVNCFQWSFDSASHNEISLTNWEEVAVFRSLQHFYNLKIGNNETVTKTPGSWITDLWVKRDGRWQLLTRLSEKLPKK